MPIQAPQWNEYLSCPICCHEFDVAERGPISLGCGHTICRTCLANLHRKQCPFDQSTINTEIDRLPVNEALLRLVGNSQIPAGVAAAYQKLLPAEEHANYLVAKSCIEQLALYLKPCQAASPTVAAGTRYRKELSVGLVSRPMQRKLVTLLGCQLVEPEGRARAVRAARSLGERSVTELILQHQNPQQLSANLWAAVRARGCQFLGPAMQEEVLKLVLLALEDGSALSRKVLVMFVVQRLEPHFPQASKTSIGHVVQLLYRASCFKVSKREGDSSLMQLKEEFRTYEALRREHDAQIVQIATEAGLRIAPDQWSALLYGDTAHKSHMQSIIDKLQTPQSFAQSVQELVIALQRTPDPGQLSGLRPQLELLAAIDPSPAEPPTLADCRAALEAVRIVVAALVDFVRQHGGGAGGGSRKSQDGGGSAGSVAGSGPAGSASKYKVSMCRDLALRGSCPRSGSCTFAHSDVELDKYRSKNRKLSVRTNLNPELKGDKSTTNNNKAFKQKDELAYHHSVKAHDNNVHRETLSVPRSIPALNETTFIEPLTTGYVLPPSQNLAHVVYPKSTMEPLHCSHYIVGPGPIDYAPAPPAANLAMWDTPQVPSKLTTTTTNDVSGGGKKQRTVAKTLAMLLQRRMEILNQLETIVGKQSPQIKTDYDFQTDSLLTPSWAATGVPGTPLLLPPNSFRLSAAPREQPPVILHDDDLVPFEPTALPPVSKYGPISRQLSKTLIRSPSGLQAPASFYNEGGGTPTPTPLTAFRPNSWYYGNQSYATVGSNGGMQATPTKAAFADNYVTLGRNIAVESPAIQFPRPECTSKDLIIESQKVKQQLKHLEKKINDLKLATQANATFTAGERLAQELQLIEAGIRERERDVRNWTVAATTPYCAAPTSATATTLPLCCQQPAVDNDLLAGQEYNRDYKSQEEDTYEAGIAHDIREFELRWEYELREEDKHWSSSEDDPSKK
ncbi:roquin-1 isoform X2 [Harpegnathos saltator]|uniref:roquin-1 isoform X2 n=1 Tax=Harpegnathos saltator TaxID=610380 RepID=UPI000DBED3C5|nr:roquin-1 isoform X2 [Harpegnathos saltator]